MTALGLGKAVVPHEGSTAFGLLPVHAAAAYGFVLNMAPKIKIRVHTEPQILSAQLVSVCLLIHNK
jgi:hypothetical protein